MVAVLVSGSGLSTRAVRISVGVAVVRTSPTVQTPVELSYVPWLGVSETNVSPAGSRSVSTTLVAASGPALLSLTRKVIVSPTLGVGSLTVLATDRSACWGVSRTLSLLLVVSGSNWSGISRSSAVLVCGESG